jgi:dihydrodipicolinate synthase/N-acetylneuraminate lyase
MKNELQIVRQRLEPLRGALPVVPTPIRPDGSVDSKALERIVGHSVGAGAGALVYPGVASEDLSFTEDDRRDCLRSLLGVAAGGLPVIAGVNSADPAEMIDITRMAVEQGADAIMATAAVDDVFRDHRRPLVMLPPATHRHRRARRCVRRHLACCARWSRIRRTGREPYWLRAR